MKKNVLITGAAGFLGRNLREVLGREPDVELRAYDLSDSEAALDRHLRDAHVIFHLAGVNRPQHEAEFDSGNAGATSELCAKLSAMGRRPKLVFSSSVQAVLDNPYGASKRKAEVALQRFADEHGAEVAIYRLKNVFGKWCRPNYNSVVATFCHNVARKLPIQISDPARELDLVYVDDVISAFVGELAEGSPGARFKEIPVAYRITLGRLADLVQSFQASRRTLVLPDLSDPFTRKLYATFVSYLPEDGLACALERRVDGRGELAEFIKSAPAGQIFVSRTKPGITRGHHFHHTKTEKFLVLEGDALIRLHRVDCREAQEYRVTGKDLIVVDIPPGYTHCLTNVGQSDLIVLFWASEVFDPQRPDTYLLEV